MKYHRDRYNNNERVQRQARNSEYKRKYGITVDRYDEILSAQGGVCAICKSPPPRKFLCVDHDHRTGRVRGLLCKTCNRGLGLLKEDPIALIVAANYVTGVAP